MYDVPNAGPPHHSWRWWLGTGWAVVLLISYLLRIAGWYRIGAGQHPTPVLSSIICSVLLLIALIRRVQQAAAQAAGTPIPAASRRGFLGVVLSMTAWALVLLLNAGGWY